MKRHKIKILLSMITILLFTGCKNLWFLDDYNIKTKEETLREFDHLDDDTKIEDGKFTTYKEVKNSNGLFEVREEEVEGLVIDSKNRNRKSAKSTYSKNYFRELANDYEVQEDILVKKNAHLEFENTINYMPKSLVNKGNIYFTDNSKQIMLTGDGRRTLVNHRNIYIINDDRAKEVMVKGSYLGKGGKAKIYLGLYVDGGKNVTTDKLWIENIASGETKIRFVFDKKEIDRIKNPKISEYDYVINAGLAKVSEAEDVFSIEGGTVPVGNRVYELVHEADYKTITNKNGDTYYRDNKWKLERKK